MTNNRLFLNRNQLKYVVILAMLIDHIAWAFVPMGSVPGQVMHFIGRLTGPTMAYFVAEGCYYTRSIKKYAMRLGIFALLSWVPYVYFEYGRLPVYMVSAVYGASHEIVNDWHFTPQFGVLCTLLLGLLAIWLWDKGKCSKPVKILGIIGLCALSFFGDWSVFDVLWCLFFFIYRKDTRSKWIAFCCIGASYCILNFLLSGSRTDEIWRLGIFMVPVLIQFGYNGESGSKKPFHKWFFYVFYPAHLLILGILKWDILMYGVCC
ncbi:MAG: TraX family protein [Ruminococcus sp.]